MKILKQQIKQPQQVPVVSSSEQSSPHSEKRISENENESGVHGTSVFYAGFFMYICICH